MFVNFLKQIKKCYYCYFKYNFRVNAKICCKKNYRRKNRKKNFSYRENKK